MKKFVLILSIVLLSNFAFADRIIIKERKGGENGYKNVNESHNGGLFGNTHRLSCWEPGNKQCIFQFPPCPIVSGEVLNGSRLVLEIIDFVNKEISNQRYLGHVLRQDGIEFYWEYIDDELTINIEI
jgi:hypothetical protein